MKGLGTEAHSTGACSIDQVHNTRAVMGNLSNLNQTLEFVYNQNCEVAFQAWFEGLASVIGNVIIYRHQFYIMY